MVTKFYFVTFILAVVMTLINICRSKKADTRFVLMGILVTCNCYGRYLLSVSGNLEIAILANKILYVGACFIIPTIIIMLVQFCGLKMHNIIRYFLYLFAAIIYLFVLTIGHNGLYYENVELGYKNGYHYLIKDYGPAHTIYPLYMVICVLFLIYYLFKAIKKRRLISIRIVMTVCLFGIAIVLCYMMERILQTTIGWLSIGYLMVIVIMTHLFNRFNMYDMTINISNYIERMQEYGYIVFDNKMRYINANDLAKKLFPNINNWNPDKVVKEEESLIYQEVVKVLEDWEKDRHIKNITVEDNYLELSLRDISYGRNNKKVGIIVEIQDKTVEQKYINTVESFNDSLKSEVEEKTANIIRMKDEMVLGMATMVESRDNSTGVHIKRTSDVVRVISDYMMANGHTYGMKQEFFEMIIKAAPMHDLGKIAVDDRILRKQGKFTDDDYREMKRHSEEGAKIVEKILRNVEDDAFVKIAKNIAHYHHEKWNGQGYPCGLSGTDIPLEARIMALADVFDALVSKRCYKEAYSYDKAFAIIENDLGTHFDPELGRIFIECRSKLEDLYIKYSEE